MLMTTILILVIMNMKMTTIIKMKLSLLAAVSACLRVYVQRGHRNMWQLSLLFSPLTIVKAFRVAGAA